MEFTEKGSGLRTQSKWVAAASLKPILKPGPFLFPLRDSVLSFFVLFFKPLIFHDFIFQEKRLHAGTKSILKGRCPREQCSCDGLGHQDSPLAFQEKTHQPVVGGDCASRHFHASCFQLKWTKWFPLKRQCEYTECHSTLNWPTMVEIRAGTVAHGGALCLARTRAWIQSTAPPPERPKWSFLVCIFYNKSKQNGK